MSNANTNTARSYPLPVKRFTRADVAQIVRACDEALRGVAETYGLTLTTLATQPPKGAMTALRCSYELQTTDHGEDPYTARTARLLGLPEDIVGKRFISRNRLFTVTDLVTRRPKYPVSASGPQGGRYKFSAAAVLRGLV